MEGLAMTRMNGLPGEFELIRRYFAPLASGFPGAFDLADDAAVIAPAPGHELVAKTDAIVGGIHFLPDDPPDLVARKALRVNLSDLAAKGAIARAYLLDLLLPAAATEAWVAGFAAGLAEDQAAYAIHLIGGDTDRTPGPLAVAVTALGEVPTGAMLRRSGARPGDTIFVTGTIGDGALGLLALRGEVADLAPELRAHLVDRYRLPRPRVALGPKLLGLATAAIDISDGLAADLAHVCAASNVQATVEAPLVPLSPAARLVVEMDAGRLSAVFGGGDDYEILFTAAAAAASELARLARAVDVPITAIGQVSERPAGVHQPVSIVDGRGRPLPLPKRGWTHF